MYYYKNKDYENALKYYNQAVKSGGMFPQPYYNIASIYTEIALKKDPQNPDREYINKAIQAIYNSLKIDPDFIYSLDQLFKIYNFYGQKEKADSIYRLIQNVQNGGHNNFQEIAKIITTNIK